jgi:hypothetical protein
MGTTPTHFMMSRALTELASNARASNAVEVRAVRLDGSAFEGRVAEVDGETLRLVDPQTLESVRFTAPELGALFVRGPNRNREGMLAIAIIVVTVAALTAYSMLPRVHRSGDIGNAFMALFALGGGLFTVLFARTGFRKWLTEWRQIYPAKISG